MLEQDKLYGMYDGIVVDNRDPLVLARLKFMVPGLIEPSSDWALPIGSPGAGSDAHGLWCVPAIGANVAVFFNAGHPEVPRYLAGPWGAPKSMPESPTFVRDLSPSDAPQMTGLQTKRWEIILDDRNGKEELVIRDRQFSNNVIRIDGQAALVEVAGAVGVQIRSTGFINIDALQVTINGRIVLPTGEPI